MVADVEAGGDRAAPRSGAARELSDARETDDEAGQSARLVGALLRVAWVSQEPCGLAGLLAPLGLAARHAREAGRSGRFYELDTGALDDQVFSFGIRNYSPWSTGCAARWGAGVPDGGRLPHRISAPRQPLFRWGQRNARFPELRYWRGSCGVASRGSRFPIRGSSDAEAAGPTNQRSLLSPRHTRTTGWLLQPYWRCP